MKPRNKRKYYLLGCELLIFAIFTSSFNLYSQCGLKKEKDAFTGKTTLSTNFEVIGKAEKNGFLSFRIIEKFENDSVSSLQLIIYINRLTERFLGEQSIIYIKSGDQILQLSLATKTRQRGTHLYSTINLSYANRQWLKDRYIDQMRVQYEEDIFDDFKTNLVDKKNELYTLEKSNYFIRIFKCLEKKERKL